MELRTGKVVSSYPAANQEDTTNVTRPEIPSTSRSKSKSSCSAYSAHSNIVAQRLAAEARHAKALLEIAESEAAEKLKLAEMRADVERRVFEAELAEINSSHRSSQRLSNTFVRNWVHSLPQFDAQPTASVPEAVGPIVVLNPPSTTVDIASAAEVPRPPVNASQAHAQEPARTVGPVTEAPKNIKIDEVLTQKVVPHSFYSPHPILQHTQPSTSQTVPSDSMKELANAIISLGNRKPKAWDLPHFDGKALNWLAFKNTYDQTQQPFSPCENQARIRTALRGDAAQEVAALLLTTTDPEEVMRALEERFANPEQIILEELAVVRALPKLQSDMKDLNLIACRVHNLVATIKHIGKVEYLYSPELFHTILIKMTPLLRALWTRYAASFTGQASKLEKLSEFLRSEARNQTQFGLTLNSETQTKNKIIPNRIHITDISDTCPFCQQRNHTLIDCTSFKGKTVDQRVEFLKKEKFCFKCLSKNSHSWRRCDQSTVCGIDGCRLRHARLVHGASMYKAKPPTKAVNYVTEPTVKESSEEVPPSTSVSSSESVSVDESVDGGATYACSLTSPQAPQRRAFLKIIPVVLRGPRGDCETYALLDDGSSCTLIDADMAKKIGVRGPEGHIRIQGVAGMCHEEKIQHVSFQIKGKFANDFYKINNARSVPSLKLCSQRVKQSDVNFPHLEEISHQLTYEEAKPTVLIGVEHWYLTAACEMRSGSRSQPVGSLTALGWVLHGLADSRAKPVHFINHIYTEPTDLAALNGLDDLIRDQFKLDSIGITKRPTSCGKDHERALQILHNTSHRLPNGRYAVGLLWREDNPYISDSYPLALSRFKSLERKMAKDSALAAAYNSFIDGIVQKGYAEECVDSYHTRSRGSRVWYLPHFAVFHPQKKKIRVVHDAAAPSAGVSLNSLLLPGPDLLPMLLGVLFRWRKGKIALVADIKEMFPQVKIIEQDQDMQRFLWRKPGSKDNIKELRMSSVMFGAACSPCTAMYILRKNAEEYADEFPDASATVKNTYMDDCIISLDDVNAAAQLALDVVTLHQRAHFEMRGWMSNNPEALKLLPDELKASPSAVTPLASAVVSTCGVLGLSWNPSTDTLSFRNVDLSDTFKYTKRNLLSKVMRLYDPLGILSPFTIHGRILLQQAWRSGVGWDEILPADQQTQWRSWIESVSHTKHIQLPRCYLTNVNANFNQVERELHLFADASEQAYACVAYWRVSCHSGTEVSFVAAKARVTPLKPVSIPRLELQGALLATRLALTIETEHEVQPHKRYFWTDSMDVLGWLRVEARTLKPFVANRVGEISESTEVHEWRWIPTSLNVADEATRAGSTVSSRWLSGPSFLLDDTKTWPSEAQSFPSSKQERTNEYKQEFKNFETIHAIEDKAVAHKQLPPPVAVDPTRFSSWLRMLRATARAHQFVSMICNRRNSKLGSCDALRDRFNHDQSSVTHQPPTSSSNVLDSDFMLRAEVHVIRRSQQESFPEELRLLQSSRPVGRHSRLFRLSPEVGHDGIMRIAGRISAATDVPTTVKRPILLDGHHHATRLLVNHYHRKFAHGFNDLVINELRQKYWILRLRSVLRSMAHHCVLCTIRRSHPITPPMGNLPPERLAHHRRAFTYVGLDYAGPLNVAVGRRREKRYIALFTCMTSRAVHLELVHSLSADAAVMCLRRFIARRGTPAEILSDNGTAFVGADNLFKKIYQESMSETCANCQIKWKFIPPAAPQMAGAWERLVRTVKVALNAILNERTPREELLITVLCEVEAIVNSRPLTDLPPEPGAEEALTPFHFLIGSSSPYSPIISETHDRDLLSRSDWRKSQRLSDMFWNRWVREYLPLLAPRQLVGVTQDLRPGDLVLVADGNLPRGSWPRGQITATLPGKDGIVRVVELTTASGHCLKRPVTKIVKLPVAPSSP